MPSPARRLRWPALALVLAFIAALAYDFAGAAAQEDHHPPADAKHDAGHAKADDHKGHDPHAKGHDAHAEHHTPTAIEHVGDANEIELFHTIWPHSIPLPNLFGFQITKFMVLEVLAALLVIIIYVP